MSIEIKVLGPGDASVLANVATDVFDHPLDLRTTLEFLQDPRHRLSVAVDDGLVVGFVSAVLHVHPDKPRPELWINEVGVAPSHWRRGIARALLDSILELGRQAGCSEAWVLTDRSNHAAMGLYASTGGEPAADDQVMFTFSLDTPRRGRASKRRETSAKNRRNSETKPG